MSIETAIVSRLRDYGSVNSLVQGRIGAGTLDPGLATPNIAYELEEDEPVQHMTGITGLAKAVLTLNVWSDDYEGAKEIREAVRKAFTGFNGQMGNYYVRGCSCKDGGDLRYTDPQNKKLNRRGVQLELTLWHKEQIPS